MNEKAKSEKVLIVMDYAWTGRRVSKYVAKDADAMVDNIYVDVPASGGKYPAQFILTLEPKGESERREKPAK